MSSPHWIEGPPSAEQVAEHAGENGRWCLYLCVEMTALPRIVMLREYAHEVEGYHPTNAGYLPVTSADGLPTDYAERAKVAELEKLLPETFYAELPLGQRIERMVSGWRRAVAANHTLEAEIAEARATRDAAQAQSTKDLEAEKQNDSERTG